MNFRTTALLFGLLLGMLWLFGLMLAVKRTPLDESVILPTLKADFDNVEIDSVQLVRSRKDKEAEEWTLTRGKDDVWLLNVKGVAKDVRTFPGKVQELLKQLRDVQKEENTPLRQNAAAYGLDNPAITVTVKGKDVPKLKTKAEGGKEKEGKEKQEPGKERQWELSVGEEKGGLVYVTGSDRPRQLFAVKRTSLSRLFDTVNAIRSPILLEYTDTALVTVSLRGKKDAKAEKFDMEMDLEKQAENTWIFQKPPFGLADWEGPPPSPLSTAPPKKESGGVKALLAEIRKLRVQSDDEFVDLGASPGNYGLADGKETYRIQVKEEKKPAEILLIGKKETKKVGKEEISEYYVKLKDDPGMAKVSASSVEPIIEALKDPGNLRNRDLLTVDIGKIDAVKLTRGKDSVDLRMTEKKAEPDLKKIGMPDEKIWQVASSVDPKWRKGDTKVIDDLLKALHGRRDIKEFIDGSDDEKLGLKTPALVIDLWVGGIDKEEKKDDKDKKNDKKDDKDKKDMKAEDKKPEVKKDPEPRIKKDAKSTVVLSFGNVKDDLVYVKREAWVAGPPEEKDKKTPEKIVTRMAVPKSLWEKLTPKEPKDTALASKDPALPYLDTAMPALFDATKPPIDFDRIVILDKDKEKLVVQRVFLGQPFLWTLKNMQDLSGRNGVDEPELRRNVVNPIMTLKAEKWLQKYDEKDADKFGLKVPEITVTLTTKPFAPLQASASVVAQLAATRAMAPAFLSAVLTFDAYNTYPENWKDKKPPLLKIGTEKEEKTVIKFGKEVKEDKTTYVYAYHSGNDMVFLANPDIVKKLREAEVRDKSGVAQVHGLLEAPSLLGLMVPPNLPISGLFTPLTTGRLNIVDPAKVKGLKLVLRSKYELREFNFERVLEKKDDKKDSVKIWKEVSPSLKEFNVNSERMTEFLEELADLKPDKRLLDRFVMFKGVPKPYHKFGDKEATAKIEATLEDGKTVTLTVGAAFEYEKDRFRGYFAQVSTWPGVVFLVPSRAVDQLLDFTFFAKERAATGP